MAALRQYSHGDLLGQLESLHDILDEEQIGLFKVAANIGLEIQLCQMHKDISITELYQLIKEKVTEERAPSLFYHVLKMVGCPEDNLKGALEAAASNTNVNIDEEYPKLNEVLKMGCKVNSLRETNYNTFKRDATRKILPNYNPNRIKSRYQLIKLLTEKMRNSDDPMKYHNEASTLLDKQGN